MTGEGAFIDSMGDSQLTAERLELALRASNEGIWDWNVGEETVFYTSRILGFFGKTEEDMPNIFEHPEDVIHASDLELFREVLHDALQPHADDLLAIDCRLANGGEKGQWLRIRGTILRDDEGRAVRMAGSMIDISRRKQAEMKADEERHLLKLVIDNVPLSVFFKDKSSHFTLANQRMLEWMKKDDISELVGKCDHDFFSAEHANAALKDEQDLMASGQPILDKLEKETWSQRADTWVQTSKFPWRNSSGEVIGTFGVSADVTELVMAQQAMAKLAIKLKEKNELMEEELLLAREIQSSFANPDNRELHVEGTALTADIGTFYVPITDLAGDFYEVLHLEDGKVGVLIADVMGHGVRSALIVSMLRGLVERERSFASEPGQFLGGLNEGLSRILNRAGVLIFATAFYAVLDLNKKSMVYACAGHPSAILKTSSGAEELDVAGIRDSGLGIDISSEYGAREASLQDATALLMFTDGIYEVGDAEDTQLGQEGLVKVVESAPIKDVHTLLDHIVSDVESYSATGKFSDDVCLLGISLKNQ